MAVGELAERVGVSQPAASQHLRILREAGLVRGRVAGRRRLYMVDIEGLERLRSGLDAYWEPALDALKDAAEAGDRP
jgi:DNA-binding transcriptional ArsR family regulator